MTWTIHNVDCLDFLRTLPDGSVDAVVTDPPYGMSYQSARRTDKTERFDKIANDAHPYVWFLADAARALVDGGRLLCFCRWDTAEAFRQAIEWAGLKLRSQIVWDREIHGMGDPRVSPSPRHDIIWYATKGRYEFQNGRPASVVRAARLSGDLLEHPNEKPIGLMGQLVGSYTSEGDTILDPFAGSGTTGVACIQTGRNFIGCEIDAGYAEIARRRCREAEESIAMFAGKE